MRAYKSCRIRYVMSTNRVAYNRGEIGLGARKATGTGKKKILCLSLTGTLSDSAFESFLNGKANKLFAEEKIQCPFNSET